MKLLALLALLLALPAPVQADADAAREQYRVARRLAAEGSPEARAALRRVVALDPGGELADDARVEQARLDLGLAWPEGVGGLAPEAVGRALALLDEVLEQANGDRVHEALYLRALARLEPAPTFDLSAARVDLVRVVAADSDWAARARHGLAWLLEREGQEARAFDAYQRLLVDEPAGEVAARARVGLARLLLRRGEPGRAAALLQAALELLGRDAGAEALRELAVRSLLREAGSGDRSRQDRIATGVRSLAAFATTAAGGALIADRKQQSVVELDARGGRVADWSVEGVQALATDGNGRRFVATGSALFRLEIGREPVAIATLGDFAPVVGLATDGTGAFWVLEKRGRRIGRIDPGAAGPAVAWEGEQFRLAALVWDGARLVAFDSKSRAVVAFDRAGLLSTVVEKDSSRSIALAADAAGRVALLDGKSGAVRFLRPDGSFEPTYIATPDVTRPRAVGLGPEGELHLMDANGDWVVFR